jgi:hypothetical protein
MRAAPLDFPASTREPVTASPRVGLPAGATARAAAPATSEVVESDQDVVAPADRGRVFAGCPRPRPPAD